MTTTLMTMTQKLASRYLDADEAYRASRNGDAVRHRSVSPGTVGKYQADVDRGKWRMNHQGIAIVETGEVLDGRHRLLAFKYAKRSALVQVTTGITVAEAHEMMLTIDCGRPRDAGTQLWIAEGVENAKPIVSAIRVEVGIAKLVKREWTGVSTTVFKELHEVQREEFEALWEIGKNRKPRLSSGVFGTLAYYATAHRGQALEFLDMYVSKVGLGKTSPVLWLNRCLDEQYRGGRRHRIGEIAFVVSNAVRMFHERRRCDDFPSPDIGGAEWLAEEAPKLTKLLRDLPSERRHRSAIESGNVRMGRHGALEVAS